MNTSTTTGLACLFVATICFTLFAFLWNIRAECEASGGSIQGSIMAGYTCHVIIE